MRFRMVFIIAGVIVLLALSCGVEKTDKGTGIPDSTPPARITDLAAIIPTDSSLTLVWTAPGDDDTTGTAAQYDIRFDFTALTDSAWDSALQPFSLPLPQEAGTPETMLVLGLLPDTTYYFGIKSADEVANWSVLSNIATGTTAAVLDTVPPAAITDLRISDAGYTFIELSWTVPGDDGITGTAATYDIRFSKSVITAQNFATASHVVAPPTPLFADSTQTYTFYDLDTNTTYYFAMKTADEVPNWSAISNVIMAATAADTIPPAAVSDLHVVDSTASSVTLAWTAPGDDDTLGQASFYDIRYSTKVITGVNFVDARRADFVPIPVPSGTEDSVEIAGLGSGTQYYFAMKTADEALNWSGVSNTAFGFTREDVDTTPPLPITTLRPITMRSSSVQVTWLAPLAEATGGRVSKYDIRYAPQAITNESWDVAVQIENEPDPQIAGGEEWYTIEGLDPSTTYFIAVRSADTAGNWSELSNVATAITSSKSNTWHTAFGSNSDILSVDRTVNGQYVMTGNAFSNDYTVRIDADGSLIWLVQFESSSARQGTGGKVVASDDGGCAVVHEDYDSWGDWDLHAEQDLIVRKLNRSGAIEWEKRYNFYTEDLNYGCSIRRVTDAGLIIGGYVTSGAPPCMQFIKLDENGGYQKRAILCRGKAMDVIQLSSGEFIFTGLKTDDFNNVNDVAVGKLSANLDTIWTIALGGAAVDAGESLIELENSDVLVVANTKSYGHGGWDIWLLRVDNLGHVVDESLIGGSGDEVGQDIIRTADGNCLIVGSTTSWGGGSNDIYLVKIDPIGHIIWEKTIGWSSFERGYSVVLAPDGGFVIGGQTSLFGISARSSYVIKTDADGEL